MENCSNIRVRCFVDELLESVFLLFAKLLQRGAKELCCVYMTEKKEKYGKTCN